MTNMPPPLPVGILEIIERTGASRSTVTSWATDPSFPQHRWIVGGSRAWDWSEVSLWHERRRLGATAPVGAAASALRRLLLLEQDECIEWPFYRTKDGYGRIKIEQKTQRVHVIACERRHGPRPSPKAEAAHSCGNRSCLNYRHLRWATRTENKADELGHGTRRSILSAEQVREIRRRRPDETVASLAREFGVSTFAVSAACNRRTWAWLD